MPRSAADHETDFALARTMDRDHRARGIRQLANMVRVGGDDAFQHLLDDDLGIVDQLLGLHGLPSCRLVLLIVRCLE